MDMTTREAFREIRLTHSAALNAFYDVCSLLCAALAPNQISFF